MLCGACTQTIILEACKIKCRKKGQKKMIFQGYMRGSKSRYSYVQHNDNNDDQDSR